MVFGCSDGTSSGGCDIGGPYGPPIESPTPPHWSNLPYLSGPNKMSGTSATHVFGVGRNGRTFHFDGSEWTWLPNTATKSDLSGVWAADATHVFAVGGNTVIRFDGTDWTAMEGAPELVLPPIWGSSPTDIYFGGGPGATIVHYDGTAWSSQVIADPQLTILALWGSSPTDVFALTRRDDPEPAPVLHFDGVTWTAMLTGIESGLMDIWGSSANDVFAVGAYNQVSHFDGEQWTCGRAPVAGLFRVWGSGPGDVYAISRDAMCHFDGASWSRLFGEPPGLYDIWGSSSTDILVLRYGNEFLHFDGGAWTARPLNLSESPTAAHSFSPDDIFVVGRGGFAMHHVRGGYSDAWIKMNSGTTADLSSIFRTSENVIAVGDNGTIIRFDGSSWHGMNSGAAAALSDVWGRLDGFVAVGDGGTILRYDGSQWTAMDSGVSANLRSVWGFSMENIFAVGSGGTILRFDGSRWVQMTSNTTANLTGVWGPSTNVVYAVGEGGSVVRRQGPGWKWTAVDVDSTANFTDVWGASSDRVFFGADTGIFGIESESVKRWLVDVPILGGHASSTRSAIAASATGRIYKFYPGSN